MFIYFSPQSQKENSQLEIYISVRQKNTRSHYENEQVHYKC